MTRLPPGLYPGLPESDYFALDAIGSTHLGWLAQSPLHFKHASSIPPRTPDALDLGTALHTSALQQALFRETYCVEPSFAEVAPLNVKPRATKAYREAVDAMQARGLSVLQSHEWLSVERMTRAIHEHPHAAKLLTRCLGREIAGVWEREGRLCRLRADALGPGLLVDIKTTRDLRGFSPWEITKHGYHVQQAHYGRGLEALGHPIEHYFMIAIESSAPHDVGVFTLEPEHIAAGATKCEHLLGLLAECERTGRYPGMFPEIQPATISNAEFDAIMALEVA